MLSHDASSDKPGTARYARRHKAGRAWTRYADTLLPVPHDIVFLESPALTHRLKATPAGWMQRLL